MPMDPFQAFLVQRRSELRRIARMTRGEHTPEDVENEAWVLADRIGSKRGVPINFSLRTDQELVLGWLHNEVVKYADKQVRYAVKLDKDWDREDADSTAHAMAQLLTAPEFFDPAILLLQREEVPDPVALTKHSYSQSSAYVILLSRFDWDTEELAAHLRILVRTLRERVHRSHTWTRLQNSPFDGIQTVPLDFEPTRARILAARRLEPDCVHATQFAWAFALDGSGLLAPTEL